MDNAITRRQALAAGAALAGTAALAGLTGCSPANQGWDGSSYLPIGTVVKLGACEGTDVKHMVMTRRPKLSATYSIDADGNVAKNEVTGIYDYALIVWPIGMYADVTTAARLLTITYANASDISEVLFMGYEDDYEKKAQAALESAREAGTDGIDAVDEVVVEHFGENTTIVEDSKKALEENQ